MKRREIREHLFKALFRRDFYSKKEIGEQGQFYFEFQFEDELKESEMECKVSKKDEELILKRLDDIMEKLPQINRLLDKAADKWELSRMAKVDLTLLRLSLFEIMFDRDVPVAVAINEAVELAKKYGGDSSPSFINGILANCIKIQEVKDVMEHKGE